jgi:hypothetical protein
VQSQSRALVSPQADFWLLGGLSFVSLAVIWALTTWIHPAWSKQIIALTFYGSLIVNYPHFIYSYQLFYKDFYSYLRSPDAQFSSKVRLSVAGILVPVLITGFFALVGITHDMRLLGYGISAYLFLSGWHYVKQGYGALITTSVYKRIFYSNWQKRILLFNAYLVWLCVWTQPFTYSTKVNQTFFDAPYPMLHCSPWLQHFFLAAVSISSLLAAGVIFRVWRIEKKGITVNGLVGYIASSYVWLFLPGAGVVLAACIPFFHSLQYLPFVYKFKKSEIEDENKSYNGDSKEVRKPAVLMGIFICIGVILGAMFFYLIPGVLDVKHGPWGNGFTNFFFFISFTAFINVHHFFIDHAFWRKDNAKIQKFLFNA